MNKQRKTSHILNVFQYDHTTGAVTLPAGLSLPTPDSADNSTKVATTAWIRAYVGSLSYATASSVTTAIANLVASAPTTLDTLNELATALGNDPNFATTITTSIGTKVPQSRTITINGTAYDLSADRAWTIASGVTSFNTRTGAITLTSGDVTGALGYTPYNATNPSGYITSSALTSYLLLAGGTMTGGLVQQANLSAWSTTTQGGGVGGIHLGAASSTANTGPAITFGARDASAGANAQAGIYINSDGNYGTRMYLATTDSYATGSKTAISISETGVVNFVRTRPTYAGNIILDAANYNSYSPTLGGTGASGTWTISISGNAATATSATTAGSADNIDGWSFVNTGSNSGTNADTIASNGISYVNANAALLGQTDGALYSQAYNSNWQHQIYGDYRTGQLVVRGKNSGTWQSWRTVLDASNTPGAIGAKYQLNNDWLRVNNDDRQFQIYGNARTMIYRTDGNSNGHGGGGYAHIFYYGGSADTDRKFIINTDGRLYSPYHGWLDTMSISGSAGSATTASRIEVGNNQWNWSTGAHTATNPNSITLWDQYSSNGGGGYLTSYATILDIYGRSGHEHDQLYFDSSGTMYHRNCFYGTNSWNGWRTMVDSSNIGSYAWIPQGGWKPSSLSSSTRLIGQTSPDGGEFALAYSGGQIHPYTDGFFYQNEGQYRVIDSNSISSQSVSYASSAGAVSWNNVSDRPGWLGGGSYIEDHSDANSWKNSGFYQNGGGGSNWPSQTWYNSINVRHSNQGNYHGFQISMSYYDNLLWFRSYQGAGSFQSWAYAISSANIGSQSVNYASSAGSTGSLDGYTWASAGKMVRGSDFYTDGWFRNYNNNQGLYNQNNGNHFYSNGGGSWGITGNGGNVELQFRSNHQTSLRGYVYGDTSSNFGLLNDQGGWSVRCNPGASYGGELRGIWNATGKMQAEYIYSSGWSYASGGNTGFYQDTYGQGFRAAAANSYFGTIATYGTNSNGYGGYTIMNNYRVILMQNSSGDFGFYNNDDWAWQLFYNRGNNCWGIGTDNTYSGDGFRCVKYGSSQYGWTTWSDRRAKENITSITGALDKVLNMRGVYFNYISDGAKTQRVGFIAQELEEVLPQAVRYAEEIDEYNVEYAQIVSVLTEAIKEQNVKITRLEALVEQLTNN